MIEDFMSCGRITSFPLEQLIDLNYDNGETMNATLRLSREVMLKPRGTLRPCTYREAIRSALVQQVLIIGLTSMVLDGGTLCCVCLYAAIGFWIGVAIIRLRRPIPTAVDLAVINAGYLPLCLVSFFCAWVSGSLE